MKTFLHAEWKKLAMVNYVVDPKILEPYIPQGTELDEWNGRCYLSLVGFMFTNTRIRGFRIPFHTDFEEINLRFYVRYKDKEEWKRGVVFIKEIVSKRTLSYVAATFYNENYETMPTSHSWIPAIDSLTVEYKWKKERWNSLKVMTEINSIPVRENSEEEFITEHYWGYTKISNQQTSEYSVEHPKWEVYPTVDYYIDVDFNDIYGKDFAFLAFEKPASVFLAEGSEIRVKDRRLI